MSSYKLADQAFVGEIERLLISGQLAEPIIDELSPASDFGTNPQPSIELLGAAFQVEHVENNIVSLPGRPFNLQYAVGLLLWTLAGSEDPDWIGYYRGRRPTQKKAAFGARLFKAQGFIDQSRISLNRISVDPGTRRTYMPIFLVDDHAYPEGEMPCAAGFQIFLRGGRLHAVTLMRAQNALNSLPLDFFLFTSLLKCLAASISVPIGSYSHFSTTFHFFDTDRDVAQRITELASTVSCDSLGDATGFYRDVAELFEFEQRARYATLREDFESVERLVHCATSFESQLARVLKGLISAIALIKLGRRSYVASLCLPSNIERLLPS